MPIKPVRGGNFVDWREMEVGEFAFINAICTGSSKSVNYGKTQYHFKNIVTGEQVIAGGGSIVHQIESNNLDGLLCAAVYCGSKVMTKGPYKNKEYHDVLFFAYEGDRDNLAQESDFDLTAIYGEEEVEVVKPAPRPTPKTQQAAPQRRTQPPSFKKTAEEITAETPSVSKKSISASGRKKVDFDNLDFEL